MSVHQTVIEWAASNPNATATAVVALVGALLHYQQTGKLPLGRVPWRYLRETFRDLKYAYADKPRPKGVPGVVTDADAAEVSHTLRSSRHFETAPAGFYYDREVLALRRPSGLKAHPQTGEEVEMELHARAFDLADGRTLWLAHDEANRWNDTGDHLSEVVLSWDRGQSGFGDALQAASISYDPVESESAAGLRVVSPDKQGDGFITRQLRRVVPTGA